MKSKPIVTKDFLKEKVKENPSKVIGRALVAIFKRQTSDEREANHTHDKNNIGFSANDARIGSLGAKYYMKHGMLLDWQMKGWLKEVNGYPRICKYAKQLNEIAEMNISQPSNQK